MPLTPTRPRSTLFGILALWAVFYASFTLFFPPLLDDADSVHAEVAREMLLRHDYVTLYANGIRYLEKAPLLYWSMAACMRVSQLIGHPEPRALAVAARVPLALTILALALLLESFARRAFHSAHAGLYAALILLSSPGIFLFTRITLPDAMVCLWLTLAIYGFWLTEGPQPESTQRLSSRPEGAGRNGETRNSDRPEILRLRIACYLFATACALNVLTKGLIGIVFPIAIVLLYLLLTRGLRGTFTCLRQLHPISSLAVFLAIAAPWHILIALANPTQGHPGSLTFTNHHWRVPLPTDGNVHGWLWFYFVNEQLLRYLNLRVPHDYDTVPLYLFWGLILIWLMPFTAFLSKATWYGQAVISRLWSTIKHRGIKRELHRRHLRSALTAPQPNLLLTLWAVFILIFFAFSTRQEYYVLPALPAIAILIAGWLAQDSRSTWQPVTQGAQHTRSTNLRVTSILLILGTLFALPALYFLLHTHTPLPSTDLATLLQQNPSDYAMSMGHFLDLNAQALGLFRLPLALAAASLFLGPLASLLLRRQNRPHAATLALATGAFGFLLAAHLGLQTFTPVLSSQQLAAAIAPQLQPEDLIVIHQEYEFGSTLGFYLQRNDLHILEGRSSNLWYGSFFPDAPKIFETPQTLAAKWPGPQRIFLWQDLANQPSALPALPGPVYVIVADGGKEIVSNRPASLHPADRP